MITNKYECFYDLHRKTGKDILSSEFAKCLDEIDELHSYRNKFAIPKTKDNKEILYMNGNSLGLMPKDARKAVMEQFDKWENRGGLGHTEEPMPWIGCDEELLQDMTDIVGAKTNELAIMSQLTVNLHLMLVTFYKPTKDRYKILCESGLFPSDNYAFVSQIEWHGFDPVDALIKIDAKDGENIIKTEDILTLIEQRGHEIALICFSGIQFVTGQFFNIKKITEAGHKKHCVVGWDLAHAVGNMPLELHAWNVDFAVWCSYKYLNCGAGGLGGLFVHENNISKTSSTYFKGWWGNKSSNRFKMADEYQPEEGALRYRLSNPSFTCCAIAKTSLKIFKEVGMFKLRKKSILLTNYLEYLLNHKVDKQFIQIITPANVSERGSQLSLKINSKSDDINKTLEDMGVFCDYREPSIFRVAPCALYNSFADVFGVVEILKHIVEA